MDIKDKLRSIGKKVLIVFAWIIIAILSLNLGAFLGKKIAVFIINNDLLPILEEFFSWIIFW